MSSTLTPTCTFCGLRFASRPLLELHIREDHRQRGNHAEPGRGDTASGGAARPLAGAPARRLGEPSEPSRTAKEVSTMTATPRRRRPRAGWATTPLRATIRAIRRLNAELLLAGEVMRRPVGAPRPGARADMPASPPEHAGTAAGRAQRAA